MEKPSVFGLVWVWFFIIFHTWRFPSFVPKPVTGAVTAGPSAATSGRRRGQIRPTWPASRRCRGRACLSTRARDTLHAARGKHFI